MSRQHKPQLVAMAAFLLLWGISPALGEEPYDVPLRNPSFSDGADDNGVPLGWSRYGGGGKEQRLEITRDPDGLT